MENFADGIDENSIDEIRNFISEGKCGNYKGEIIIVGVNDARVHKA